MTHWTWSLCWIVALSGCGWFGGEEQNGTDSPAAPVVNVTPETSPAPEPRAAPKATGVQLRLSLPKDQPVPLLKTVEQTLVQQTPQGTRVSRNWLELLVVMRLEDATEDGRQRLSVRYERVRYHHEVAGQQSQFDSDRPPAQIPVEALPYAGLVDNGFEFWIGPDHRILQPVGFADFLKRCLRHVPAEQQAAVLETFADATEEGVANFVDDSLGFLPSGDRAVNPGDHWQRERRLTRPVPLFLSSRCSLGRLTDQAAEIDIAGVIATTKTFGPLQDGDGDIRVLVRGGHEHGSCLIDRATGLPLRSSVKRYVDMTVQQADGTEFEQQKVTTTQVRLFPQQSQSAPPVVVPASHRVTSHRSRSND